MESFMVACVLLGPTGSRIVPYNRLHFAASDDLTNAVSVPIVAQMNNTVVLVIAHVLRRPAS